MPKVLLIDGCARGWEISRTYAVTEAFLETYRRKHPDDTIDELHLTDEHPEYFTAPELETRNELLSKGALTEPYFRLARQFARADKIILAAPYWDLSFPAIVKVYIEHISVCGITFAYGENGEEIGKCVAKKFVYITTSGGAFPESEIPYRGTGVAYLKGLCKMFGIQQFDCLWTMGLDIKENDAQALLEEGKERSRVLAREW